MTIVALTLEERFLQIRCDSNGLRVHRQLSDSDFERFKQWSSSYVAALSRELSRHTMLQIGGQMREWLDGGERCLERVLNAAEPPLVLEFSTIRADPEAREFLDAPWELLADASGCWAERCSLVYCPVRRLGQRWDPLPPSPYKLSAVFMAAAPKGVGQLRLKMKKPPSSRRRTTAEWTWSLKKAVRCGCFGAECQRKIQMLSISPVTADLSRSRRCCSRMSSATQARPVRKT